MPSVLVTGASSGIGRATALRMDAAGWRVFAGVRKEEDGVALQEAASGLLAPVRLDVTAAEQIEDAAEQIASEVGEAGLDGLVSNAGITMACPLEAMSLEDFRHLLEVNLIGGVAVTQALLPQLRRASGRLVLVSSVSALRAPPLLSAYSASKAGMEAVGDVLRVELLRQGIAVSIVEPGPVETPVWTQVEPELEATQKRTSVELDGRYEKMIGGFLRLLERGASRRITSEKVADSIERALVARRPRTRYLVGPEAHGQKLANRLLSDRMLDSLTARMLRI